MVVRLVTAALLIVSTAHFAQAQAMQTLGPPASYVVDWTLTVSGSYSRSGPLDSGGSATQTLSATGTVSGRIAVAENRITSFELAGGVTRYHTLVVYSSCAGGGESVEHRSSRNSRSVIAETAAQVTDDMKNRRWAPLVLHEDVNGNRLVSFSPPLEGGTFMDGVTWFHARTDCQGNGWSDFFEQPLPSSWELDGGISAVPLAGPITGTLTVSETRTLQQWSTTAYHTGQPVPVSITVNATITILEDARCDYELSPTGMVIVGRAGARLWIAISPSWSGCTWTASAVAGAVNSIRPTSGFGRGGVHVEMGRNPYHVPRNFVLQIAGELVLISQAGAVPSSPIGDVNVDGRPDLLWQHTDGRLIASLMDRATVLSNAASMPPGVSDPNWRVAGVGDLDGDQFTDFVWQNVADGRVGAWRMIGLYQVEAELLSLPRLSDIRWRVASVGDFNGDGRADLIWQHQIDRRVAIWTMHGFQVTAGGLLDTGNLTGPGWNLVGNGDFDADGSRDLVFQHDADGAILVYLMNGTQFKDTVRIDFFAVLGAGWQIRAVADVDGDGHSDFIGQHVTDHAVAVWLMDGVVVRSGILLPSPLAADPDWRIVGPK